MKTIERKGLSIKQIFSVKNLKIKLNELHNILPYIYPRDIIDQIDEEIFLQKNIDSLSQSLKLNTYQPQPAVKYEVGKTKGNYKLLYFYSLTDLLVFYTLSDALYKYTLHLKSEKAYFFKRNSQINTAETKIGKGKIIINTDISNYFGSLNLQLLYQYLRQLKIPKDTVALLEKLINQIKSLSEANCQKNIGIFSDDFDCSRQLAHIYLYPHDSRMIKLVGRENYIRWVDDQYIIINNPTEAKHIINQVQRSLNMLHLSLNSAKTIILTEKELDDYFQFHAHNSLNNWERKFLSSNRKVTSKTLRSFSKMWESIKNKKITNKINWDKVLKRIYNFATKIDYKGLEKRAFHDLINSPDIDDDIFKYFALRNQGQKLISLFTKYCRLGHNLYETTEMKFFENALLLTNPSILIKQKYCKIAGDFLLGRFPGQTHRSLGKTSAILLLYWFNKKTQITKQLIKKNQLKNSSPMVIRAWIIGNTVLNKSFIDKIKLQFENNPSVKKIIDFIFNIFSGKLNRLPNLFIKPHDVRSWLLLELASYSSNPQLKQQVKKILSKAEKDNNRLLEKNIIERIKVRLNNNLTD